MKRLVNYVLLSAIALAGTVAFSACSSTEDSPESTTAEGLNPGYNAETNEVPVDFVLNVANGTAPVTRQGGDAVQTGANTFRGMEGVKLFSYKDLNDPWVKRYTEVTKYYDMDRLLDQGAINDENSKRVLNMSIPVGSNAMLFFGKAPSPTTDEEKNRYGWIDYDITFDENVNQIETHFRLQKRQTDELKTKLELTESLAAAILTELLDTKVRKTVNGVIDENQTYSWADAGADYDNPNYDQTELENSMGEMYSKITHISSNELRAGSSEALCQLASDIKATLEVVNAATPTGDLETTARNLALAVRTKWNIYFNIPETSPSVRFMPIEEFSGYLGSKYTTEMQQITDVELKNFPQCYGLPAGVSLLTWNTTEKKFEYKNVANSLMEEGLLVKEKITYPAELTYYCNSGIRATSTAKKFSEYPNGVTNWLNNDSWTGWNDAKVTSSTMAVAMRQNVNYGVAMLKTNVKYVDGVTAFNDNRHAFIPEENDKVIAKANLNLKLKGLLIGGQPSEVGWDFTRRIPMNSAGTAEDPSAACSFDHIIYDNMMAGSALPLSVPTANDNYTLVFDNYNSTPVGGNQDAVFVALELVNEGDPFWGKTNLINTGSTFYLLGKLDPTTVEMDDSKWDANYQTPPIGADGQSTKIKRVFIQDFLTEAIFRIGQNSLKSAYVTVPDLRATQMSFGLSVDIQWRPGLVFDTTIGQ